MSQHRVSKSSRHHQSILVFMRLVCLVSMLHAFVSFGYAQSSDVIETREAAIVGSVNNEQCNRCHDQPSIAKRRPSSLAAMVRVPEGTQRVMRAEEDIPKLYVNSATFAESAHAGLSCQDCHPDANQVPHNQLLPSLSCDVCHTEVADEMAHSVHAMGDAQDGLQRPNCADCHDSAHAVKPVSEGRSYPDATRSVEMCARCHDNSTQGVSMVESYRENVHGHALFETGLALSATCVDCHGSHGVLPPDDPQSTVNPHNVPETCGECHAPIADEYFSSVHGQHLLDGDDNAATCTSCHNSHGIVESDEEFLHGIIEECSHCHIGLGKSYLESFHGKAAHLGHSKSAVCSSCHGAHDILPKEDPRSRVSDERLLETCQTCHADANDNFILYDPHVDLLDREANPQAFWTFVVMTTLLCSVLLVFIPHSLLWFQRTLIERLKHPSGFHRPPPTERWVERFRPIHRFTHFLIVISFMGLVITGFPLKYSNADWALTMASWMGGAASMGILHRIFAIITFAYAGVHLGFLIYFFYKHCPKPRYKFLFGPNSLLFTWRDLKDFIGMMRWFLWLGPRPKLDRWVYYEKFDYFGEIWGIFLIGSTGIILWVPEFFSRWLPGWVINCAMVVHSIEALLAASVIFLVHFFNTHIRPEKFPIDMVMLTGQMTESEMKEERPDEYERLVKEGKLEERIVPPVALHWRILGALAGMTAFFLGIVLIILALRMEILNVIK